MSTKTLALKILCTVAAAGAVALASGTASSGAADGPSAVERGKYLVDAIGCADCHTPLVMGPKGPERDLARHLSGHPQDLELPAAPALEGGQWAFTGSATLTAWSGPWGTSYTANLTPDVETGLGSWTADQFIDTLRTRRRLGRGRPLLPPMPAEFYAHLSDDDLRAIFAYLQSLPPVVNRVPQALPPAE